MSETFAAIDVGASSGRIIAGHVTTEGMDLEVVHRFDNNPIAVAGSLRWDFEYIVSEMVRGLTELRSRHGPVASIGIDTWAIDYGVIDADCGLVDLPRSYRDPRWDAGIAAVRRTVPDERFYELSGLQFLPFTTIYQLAVDTLPGRSRQAMLMPDLLAHHLTGGKFTERTNASTTGLYDVRSGDWSPELLDAIGFDTSPFPPLIDPGETIGTLRRSIADEIGLPRATPVVAVGTHDTASAVVGVPACDGDFAYISSGTWSLAGVELGRPVLDEDSRTANFTNESGVDGTTRFLRNVGGLWLLQESIRQWRLEGSTASLDDLLAGAENQPPGPRFDIDSNEFVAPGDMPDRIRHACRKLGYRPPGSPAEVTRSILDSLAAAYADTVRAASRLSGCVVRRIHIVGGGSQNKLLCQLTADASGLPVSAGPVEATAIGNVLIQARANGTIGGSLDDLRAVAARSFPQECYIP